MSANYMPEAMTPPPHIERDEYFECFRVFLLGREIARGKDLKALRDAYPNATGWKN